jgi:hypothetical protein
MTRFAPIAVLALSLAAAAVGCGGKRHQIAKEPSPGIDAGVESQRSAFSEAEPVGELHRGSIDRTGTGQQFRVEMEVGQCYYLVGQGDDQVQKLALYLWDGTGSRVASEGSSSNTVVLSHCPESTGLYKFESKVKEGAGHFAVGVFKKPNTAKAVVETPAEPAKVDRGLALEKIITAEAAAVAAGATQKGTFYKAGAVEVTDWYIELQKGQCYWFIGAATDEVDDYYIYLWDPANVRIGQTKADTNKATFGHCPVKTGMFHLQVKVDDEDGAVRLGVFEKKQGG